MTHLKRIQMPETLSTKDITTIVYLFKTMSLAAKHDFLSTLIVEHPNHYKKINVLKEVRCFKLFNSNVDISRVEPNLIYLIGFCKNSIVN